MSPFSPKILWLRLLMRFSDLPRVGPLLTWLAGWGLGPYKDKRLLAAITSRPYISPRAQIKCPRLYIGANAFIDDFVTIYAHRDGGEIRLGRRVHIYRGTILEIGAGGSIFIGDNTHIQASCNLKGFVRDLRIGANVQISPHCAFSPYEHNIEDVTRPIWAQGLSSKGDIVIEDDVWLGLGVKVLDGVTIGKGAVIGAGAVVTRDIPPYSIAVGIPARVIRKRGERPTSGPETR